MRAVITDSHRDGAGHLRPGHPDRQQQAQLSPAFVHRKGEGVGDADEGDDEGQPEQPVDQVADDVDLAGHALLERGLVLQFAVGPPGQNGVEGGLGWVGPTPSATFTKT